MSAGLSALFLTAALRIISRRGVTARSMEMIAIACPWRHDSNGQLHAPVSQICDGPRLPLRGRPWRLGARPTSSTTGLVTDCPLQPTMRGDRHERPTGLPCEPPIQQQHRLRSFSDVVFQSSSPPAAIVIIAIGCSISRHNMKHFGGATLHGTGWCLWRLGQRGCIAAPSARRARRSQEM